MISSVMDAFSRCGVAKRDGTPKDWPHSAPRALRKLPHRVVIKGGEQEYYFKSNLVTTSKYTILSFIPKLLLEELNPEVKFANVFFLIIAILQVIPAISNTGGLPTTLIALVIVIVISAIIKGIDDVRRHRADRQVNFEKAEVWDAKNNEFVVKYWKDICVGDMVKVNNRQAVPADILICGVSDKDYNGTSCYVETKNLDGETNLKIRHVLPAMLKYPSMKEKCEVSGRVTMEHPNSLINEFVGVIRIGEDVKANEVPIQPTNLLLRGCIVRGTDSVLGLVLNTGHDVKVMRAKLNTNSKEAALESSLSLYICIVLCVLVFFGLMGAMGQAIFNDTYDIETFRYLKWDPARGKQFVIMLFYEILLHATVTPVSLYISMNVVRFGQSIVMMRDEKMKNKNVANGDMMVRTMTLNEDLGMVSYIFADKTGTLTCNQLNFRKMVVNSVPYGQGITEVSRTQLRLQKKTIPAEVEEAERIAAERAVPHVSFYCPKFECDIDPHAADTTQGKKLKEFLLSLALCHEVLVEKLSDNSIRFSAPNPDDEALVCGADYLGYKLVDRKDDMIIVHETETKKDLQFKLLLTVPFTSDRKRMSVVIRDQEGDIRIITKGADSVFLPPNIKDIRDIKDERTRQTFEHVEKYAEEGLRCLLVGTRKINSDDFDKWLTHYNLALGSIQQIDLRKGGLPNAIDDLENELESGLTILGATGIEDRLQDGLSDAVAQLTGAGIRIWMLTGDKLETSKNIALASNLIQNESMMDILEIEGSKFDNDEQMISLLESGFQMGMSDLCLNYKKSLAEIVPQSNTKRPCSLIIDGVALLRVKNNDNLRDALLRYSLCCTSVICVRVSPDQKRQMVDLVKTCVPKLRTLAIGDGANDVAMINAAHVGVGISGEEGLQAVNASDYAINQFRFLIPLLLFHGRQNYSRQSTMVNFQFYKNFIMTMAMFWYNFYCGWSATKVYTEGGIQLYNIFYSSVPIVLYAIFDSDISYSSSIKHSRLYRQGNCNGGFLTVYTVLSSVAEGLIESVYMFFMSMCLLLNFDRESGTFNSHMQLGAMMLTSIIVTVNLKVLSLSTLVYPIIIYSIAGGIALWILIALGITNINALDAAFYGIYTRLLDSPVYWLTVIVSCTGIVVKDIFIATIRREFFSTNVSKLQEIELDDERTSRQNSSSFMTRFWASWCGRI